MSDSTTDSIAREQEPRAEEEQESPKSTPPEGYVDIVFAWPPGPLSEFILGEFTYTEDHEGKSVKLGTWIARPDGFLALRVKAKNAATGTHVPP